MKKKEAEGISITLNQSFVLIAVVMLFLVFVLGYLSSSKKSEQSGTIFTRDELERIVKLQEMEDKEGTGGNVCASKDSKGNLMISWVYEDE